MMNGEKDLASEDTKVAGLKLPQFPQLKQTLLCKIFLCLMMLKYAIFGILVGTLSVIPDNVKVFLIVGACILTLADMFRNFAFYLTTEMTLEVLHCLLTGGWEFSLPQAFSAQELVQRCGSFGRAYEPAVLAPRPAILRYRSGRPAQMFASGIEKIIAVYPVAMLDEDTYRRIHASAAQNAKALKGRMKHVLLARPQKKAPIEQVTVVLIVADQVEEAFRSKLKNVASKQVGDGETVSMIPCVVDLEKQRCIFDSTREVFLDGHYPVKNRGIRLIKRYLFRGGLQRIGDSNDFLKNEAAAAENGEEKEVLEMSFREFTRMTKKEMAGCDEEDAKRFKQMKHREIVVEGEYLYLKWEQSGIWTALEMDEKARTVKLDPIVSWYYPRARKIDKETVKKLKKEIGAYFAGEGCTVKYNTVR